MKTINSDGVSGHAGETRKTREQIPLFDFLPLGIVYHGRDGTIAAANPAAQAILGFSLDQMRGSPSIDPRCRALRADGSPFPEEEHPAVISMRTGLPVRNVQMGIFHPVTEDMFWINVSAFPDKGDAGEENCGVYAIFEDITNTKRTEEAEELAQKLSERLKIAARTAHFGIWDWDIANNNLIWDDTICEIYGVPHGGFTGSMEKWREHLHPDDRSRVGIELQAAQRGECEYAPEFRIIWPDGSIHYIKANSQTFFDKHGKPLRMVGSNIDITERKAAEARSSRLTQLYAALSQCHQSILRSATKEELLADICRVVVEFGGIKMAWIGLVDEASGTLDVESSFGGGTEYLERISISLKEDDPLGRGPTGTAIRENRPVWCQDFQNDPSTMPWHESGSKYGWATSASLPIHHEGKPVGALTIYSAEAGFFDEDARALLVEMACDMSLALDRLAHREERRETEEEVRAAAVYARNLIETSLDPLVTISAEGKITDVNAATENITGLNRDRLVGTDFCDYFTEPELARAGYLKVFSEGKVTDYPLALRHSSRAISDVLYNASVYRNDQGEVLGVFAAARDITASAKAAEELRASEERFRIVAQTANDLIYEYCCAAK